MALDVWRDGAIIVLVIEGFLLGLIPLVLMVVMIRGLGWLNRRVHMYATLVREQWRRVHEQVVHYCSLIQRPFSEAERLSRLLKRRL